MKRHYNRWSEILTGNISQEDREKIRNSVQLYIRTPKGWSSCAVCWTRAHAEEYKQRILSGKIKLKYPHELRFKIG